jgi:hypothetical protein
MLFLATFLLLTYALSRVSRFPLVLFPPLIVIAYEMFAHADVCPWASRPLTLPVACTLGAAIGTFSIGWFGVGPFSVVIALTAGIATLRMLKLHMPPVLGISLLPQVLPHSDWTFILAVAIGASGLTGFFLIIQPVLRSAFFVRRRGKIQ